MTAPFGIGFAPPGPSGECTCVCAETACVVTRNCCTTTANVQGPVGWKLVVPDVGNLDPPKECDQCCGDMGGTFWLYIRDRMDCFDAVNGVWVGGAPFGFGDADCTWGAVDELGRSDTDRFPVRQYLCATPCETNDNDRRDDIFGSLGVHVSPVWVAALECGDGGNIRLAVVGQVLDFLRQCGIGFFQWVPVVYALYRTAYMSGSAMQALIDASDVTPISLDLVTISNPIYNPDCVGDEAVPSPYGCDFPATVTVSKLSDDCSRLVAGCEGLCDPALDSEAGVVKMSASVGGTAFSLCLIEEFPEETCRVQFQGTKTGLTVGACEGLSLTFTMICATDEGTGVSSWVMRVTNDATSVSVDVPFDSLTASPIQGSVSGTLSNVCGASVAFAADVTDCTEADLPFRSCCPSATVAELCCIAETLPTQGILHDFPAVEHDCAGTTGTASYGFGDIECGNGVDPPSSLWGESRHYYRGAVPIDDSLGGLAQLDFVVSCNDGSWAVDIINRTTNCPDAFGATIVSGSCFSWLIELQWPTDNCNTGGAGAFRVQIG